MKEGNVKASPPWDRQETTDWIRGNKSISICRRLRRLPEAGVYCIMYGMAKLSKTSPVAAAIGALIIELMQLE